jgi:hypothetical protein
MGRMCFGFNLARPELSALWRLAVEQAGVGASPLLVHVSQLRVSHWCSPTEISLLARGISALYSAGALGQPSI